MDDDRSTKPLAQLSSYPPDSGLARDANMQRTPMCAACHKTFSTAGNLARHLASSIVCTSWLDACPAAFASSLRGSPDMADWDLDRKHAFDGEPRPVDTTDDILTGTLLLDHLLSRDTVCPYCLRMFSTVGCVNRHYKTSLVCDRWRASKLLELMLGQQVRPALVNGRPTAFGRSAIML